MIETFALLFFLLVVVVGNVVNGLIICDPISWIVGPSFYGDGLLYVTRIQKTCDFYIEQNDLYSCDIITPWQQCNTSAECPEGSICFLGSAPFLCMKCTSPSTSQPSSTWSTNFTVITNVTEAMMNQQFWTYDDFYDHRGVDEIKTYSKWSWSSNMKALQYDFVQQHRSTWHDQYDCDVFRTNSQVITLFNKTHVRSQVAGQERSAFDNGKIQLSSSTTEEYAPIP